MSDGIENSVTPDHSDDGVDKLDHQQFTGAMNVDQNTQQIFKDANLTVVDVLSSVGEITLPTEEEISISEEWLISIKDMRNIEDIDHNIQSWKIYTNEGFWDTKIWKNTDKAYMDNITYLPLKVAKIISQVPDIEDINLSGLEYIDPAVVRELGKLPRLTNLYLDGLTTLSDETAYELAHLKCTIHSNEGIETKLWSFIKSQVEGGELQ